MRIKQPREDDTDQLELFSFSEEGNDNDDYDIVVNEITTGSTLLRSGLLSAFLLYLPGACITNSVQQSVTFMNIHHIILLPFFCLTFQHQKHPIMMLTENCGF